MGNRHLDTGRSAATVAASAPYKRAADDVGDVVRAGDPAVEGDCDDQKAGAHLPQDSRSDGLPGHRECGADRDGQATAPIMWPEG